eukprot:Gregarina_sp_Poly_1__1851@NODE_1482_length_4034_cov_11_704815_g982_i0_p1_GENE_NODE_1482_length_4034_cov_11_704815_g982_i0NODE_1482_length_4034_cov_11_704815_g982_i0_p1_ORF_typecomplete_len230_score44_20_NODE_1482_length_4034_cov_11_704815_g982_i04081097
MKACVSSSSPRSLDALKCAAWVVMMNPVLGQADDIAEGFEWDRDCELEELAAIAATLANYSENQRSQVRFLVDLLNSKIEFFDDIEKDLQFKASVRAIIEKWRDDDEDAVWYAIGDLLKPFVKKIDMLLKSEKAKKIVEELIPIVSEICDSSAAQKCYAGQILILFKTKLADYQTTHTENELLSVLTLAAGIVPTDYAWSTWEKILGRLKSVENGSWGKDMGEQLNIIS